MRGEKLPNKDQTLCSINRHSWCIWIFLNVLSSSQNRINIRISKIDTTSVINVIVTFIQSTLSKTSQCISMCAAYTQVHKESRPFWIWLQNICATCGLEKKINIQLPHTSRHEQHGQQGFRNLAVCSTLKLLNSSFLWKK